ncbi:pyridoxamine 5'-phosphate oxidase family protein [Actinomadura hibisca]|uniref:PdmM n=1 Tax=Actinomadura hibisca TaxID=68565 RepID=A1YZ61_9ACTN|nr:pyridoxamine 5'-phosphate oxidase family protein [Actinomadura hibisca]ABM21746.1 PdmM [Actinomadura hibisca]
MSARGVTGAPPRSPAQRKQDALDLLATVRHTWAATGGEKGAHLVPLACVWDGGRVVMSTKAASLTARNLAANGTVRLAFGTAEDVVLLDGEAALVQAADVPDADRAALAALPLDPGRVPGCVYLFVVPRRVLAWRHLGEMADRVIMSDGRWVV